MDNVTHTITGALTAELVVRARERFGRPVSLGFVRAAWFVSMLAHNTPDFDAVYTRITRGQIGYLVHHRGHTHTLALVPLMALIALLPVLPFRGARGLLRDRDERWWLLALAIAGPIAHVALDFSNDYGVHPFWPFSNRWVYGDAIFIVEPFFWMIPLPVLLWACRTRAARFLWGALLAIGLVLVWRLSIVPRVGAIGVTLAAAVMVVVCIRASAFARAAAALGACLVVVAAFASGSAVATRELRAVVERAHPGWKTLDIVRTPRAGTPLCWLALVVQENEAANRYAMRSMVVSAWPSLIDAVTCARSLDSRPTAPVRLEPAVNSPTIVSRGTYESSLDVFRAAASRCDVSAYLRWSRAPFVLPAGDPFLVVGDLRYDREPALEFSEQALAEAPDCPRHVPPWTPPRSDLLGLEAH